MKKKIQVGDTIRFKNWRGEIVEDVVRGLFVAERLLEPYARNEKLDAAVLTSYSWILMSEILDNSCDQINNEKEQQL